MYRLDREEFVQSPYIFLWSTLGFQAGFINAFGFLACGRYVSHVTGFGTQIGMALGANNLLFAIELLGFPLSFIMGAFVSSFLTIARLERNEAPWYGLITALLPFTISILLFFGINGYFGIFGEPPLLAHDFALLFLLSFVCGMQNGCFATLTKGQIRTTHLTGISTDIGTDFARMWFGKLSANEYTLTKKTNISRIATFSAFTAGSVLSVLVSKHFTYMALTVPLITALGVCIAVRSIHLKMDVRFKRALKKAKQIKDLEVAKTA